MWSPSIVVFDVNCLSQQDCIEAYMASGVRSRPARPEVGAHRLAPPEAEAHVDTIGAAIVTSIPVPVLQSNSPLADDSFAYTSLSLIEPSQPDQGNQTADCDLWMHSTPHPRSAALYTAKESLAGPRATVETEMGTSLMSLDRWNVNPNPIARTGEDLSPPELPPSPAVLGARPTPAATAQDDSKRWNPPVSKALEVHTHHSVLAKPTKVTSRRTGRPRPSLGVPSITFAPEPAGSMPASRGPRPSKSAEREGSGRARPGEL